VYILYTKFTGEYAENGMPLTQLMEVRKTFQQSPDTEAAFRSLKSLLCTAQILCYPELDRKFTVDTDTSKEDSGGVLA
jgi:hypothetical protein